MLGCEPQSNNGSPSISIIYIKNIGLGPAIEFSFEVDEIDDGRKHYPILRQTTSQVLNDSVNLLRPGEEAALGIQIFFNFDPINSDDMEDLEGWGRVVKSSVLGKYKNFKIGITVKYRDMYQNEFNQKITLKSSMGAKYNKDSDHAEHTCELHVDEITNPTRVASKKGNGKK